MLRDLTLITSKIFDEAFDSEKPLLAPKIIYDLYRNLGDVIGQVDTVAVHYLVQDFTEEYLQDSSWGEPVDKWRKFLNMDFKRLNDSVKIYLLTLFDISFEHDESGSILSHYYNSKSYYGFVTNEYSVGFIEPCSSLVKITALTLDSSNPDNRHIQEHREIDITTLESKRELQEQLYSANKKLKEQQSKLKQYIKRHYTLDDLL